MIFEQKLTTIFDRVPTLPSVLQKLDEHKIPWMIGGSGCLFLLGNERVPDDVDIFLKNEDHERADKIFGITSFEYTSPLERVRNSNPGGEHAVQLTSGLQITVEGKRYDMSVTEQVLANRVSLHFDKNALWLMPPEDVLLIKAILQRGQDMGKRDVEDVKAFLAIHKINRAYLEERITYLHAGERVGDVLC